MNVQKGKINHNPPLQTGQYQNQQNRNTSYNLHTFDGDATQKFTYGTASYVGGSPGQVPSRLPLGSPLAGPNNSISTQPSGPNSGGMPQGPPPGTYPSHGPLDLSKQTPPIHQPAHHSLPPGTQQIPMANPGHGGPMQPGRSAQGNAQFFGRGNPIRPANQQFQRPPMAGTSMNPNHPPSTPAMAMAMANSSLGINPPLLYYFSGDSFNNQQMFQQFQHPAGYFPGGGNMHSGAAPFNAPRATQPTFNRSYPSPYQFTLPGSQGKTVYFTQPQQTQQQPQTPAPPAVASGAPPSQPRETTAARPVEQKRKRQPIPIVVHSNMF